LNTEHTRLKETKFAKATLVASYVLGGQKQTLDTTSNEIDFIRSVRRTFNGDAFLVMTSR